MTDKILVLGVVLLVGLGAGVALGHWHYSPRLAAADARADLAERAVKEQNEKIGKLHADAETRAKAAAAALAKANIARREAERQVVALLDRAPPEGVDVCEAASNLITEELGL